MTTLTINGKAHTLEVSGDTPLLWVLRDTLGLTGTKFGCGIAQCGACTVHIEGMASPSCIVPISALNGKSITTIEGLSTDNRHPLQQAWIAEEVPQCGYCQSGMLMSAAALLNHNPKPSDEEIHEALSRNLCRCGTYNRVRQAIKRAAGV